MKQARLEQIVTSRGWGPGFWSFGHGGRGVSAPLSQQEGHGFDSQTDMGAVLFPLVFPTTNSVSGSFTVAAWPVAVAASTPPPT